MSTITGAVLTRLGKAAPVGIAVAAPQPVPGWYTLEVTGAGSAGRHLLYIGETDDLADRLEWHLQNLSRGGLVDLGRVLVRWVEAAPLLGAGAWQHRARAAVEAFLVATLCPEWSVADVPELLPR